jgi:hypothetical protein
MSDQEVNAPRTELRIAIRSGQKDGVLDFGFDISGEDPVGPLEHPYLTAAVLNDRLPEIRKLLSEWADKYKRLLVDEKESKLKMGSDDLKDMWHALATWGWSTYNELFDVLARGNENLVRMTEGIKGKAFEGWLLIINSHIGDIPWGLLYDQMPPDKKSPNFLEEVKKNFWGLKYQMQATPLSNPSNFPGLSKHILDNEESTRLTVTINEKMDIEYQTNHKGFFDKLSNEFKLSPAVESSPMRLTPDKQKVIDSFHDRQEPQHLYYFYCHHTKADGIYTYRGYRNFDRSKLIISGKDASDESVIGFTELFDDPAISAFQKPPVVFVNACESVQQDIGNPLGFLFIFAYKMAAYPFIGTEAPIPAAFADDFGRQFVERFLQGQSIGRSIFDLKREYAEKHDNPFGLYYSLYGNANTRLSREVIKL